MGLPSQYFPCSLPLVGWEKWGGVGVGDSGRVHQGPSIVLFFSEAHTCSSTPLFPSLDSSLGRPGVVWGTHKAGAEARTGRGKSGAAIFILAYVYSLDPFENYIVYVMFWYHFILGIGSGARLSRSKSLFHSCVALETVPRFPHL